MMWYFKIQPLIVWRHSSWYIKLDLRTRLFVDSHICRYMYKVFFLLFFLLYYTAFHRFSFQCGNALYRVVDYVIFVAGDIVNPKLLSEYQLSRIFVYLWSKNTLLVSNTNVLYTPFTRLLLCIRMFIPATIFISLWLTHGLLFTLGVHD